MKNEKILEWERGRVSDSSRRRRARRPQTRGRGGGEKQKQGDERGFTIIEVVLVLAIAGLIFLMVFIALPNMQRSQRDMQRRQDYANLVANMTNYIVNNGGSLPKTNTGCYSPVGTVNTDGQSPSGNNYTIFIFSWTNFAGHAIEGGSLKTSTTVSKTTSSLSCFFHLPLQPEEIIIVKNSNCENGIPVYNAGNRSFSIFAYMETSSSFCMDNGS